MQIAMIIAAIGISRVFPSRLHSSSSTSSVSDLPGYRDFNVQPHLASSSEHGSFVFGRASEPINKHAFIEIPLGDGKTIRVPKGIYHYSERSQDIGTDAAVPQPEHPFQASGSYKSYINNVNGIYLPMPFGMDPINLQLLTEERRGRSLSGDINSGIDRRVKRALDGARKRCLKTANIICEQALKKYYALRAKQIEQQNAPLQEKLMGMGAEVMSELGSKILHYNSLGVLFGMPGIKPVYMGAGVDRSTDSGTVLDMSLPY